MEGWVFEVALQWMVENGSFVFSSVGVSRSSEIQELVLSLFSLFFFFIFSLFFCIFCYVPLLLGFQPCYDFSLNFLFRIQSKSKKEKNVTIISFIWKYKSYMSWWSVLEKYLNMMIRKVLSVNRSNVENNADKVD